VADRSVWLTPRAVRLHAVILVVVPGFMALCVWQIYRALGGNELSWAYVFEWPFFAAYAIYMWWRFVHEAPETPSTPVLDREGTAAADRPDAAESPESSDTGTAAAAPAERVERLEAEDAELAAYNNYLAQLAARDKAAGR
jgi:hypothetical protein